jgi:pantoate--beta-alanine ligase
VKVYSKTSDLKNVINNVKAQGKTIGFVPTMGALHNGHISLVNTSEEQCDITIVSIFVNPTQFNNIEDLNNYPRTLEEDIKLLEKSTNCDILFSPSFTDVYPEDFQKSKLNLGLLENVMEGKHRPGHFEGVVNVVKRLFEIVEPTKAFFGLKDFQQVAVIKYMTKAFSLPVEIMACPTLRETSGLAMSSRNQRLSENEKEEALIIHKTLLKAKELSSTCTPREVIEKSISFFEKGNLKLEYFEIVNPLTLESLDENWTEGSTACIVAYCGEVRLIDNLQLT